MRRVRTTYPCAMPAMLHESFVHENKAEKLLSRRGVPYQAAFLKPLVATRFYRHALHHRRSAMTPTLY